MEIKILRLLVNVVINIKNKEIFKERCKCIIVKGAEHRFKSFAFREARMQGALDFLKEELL